MRRVQVKFSGQLLDGTMSLLAVGQPRPDNTIAQAKIRTLKIEEMDEMNFVLTIGLKGWFFEIFSGNYKNLPSKLVPFSD